MFIFYTMNNEESKREERQKRELENFIKVTENHEANRLIKVSLLLMHKEDSESYKSLSPCSI